MNNIVSNIYGHGRGWSFSPNDFNGISSRDNIKQTLSRLENSGTIRRVIRGIYDYPRKNKFSSGFLGPDPEQVAAAIARKFKWSIQPAGDTALNLLGLSTQMVAHYIYTSDGPTRVFKWGDKPRITFRHTRKRDLADMSPRTALVVLSLKALGRTRVTQAIIDQLKTTLTNSEKKLVLKETRHVTGWIYDILLKICSGITHA